MAFGKREEGAVVIKAANILRTSLAIRGTAPLVIHKFSAKSKAILMASMSTPTRQKKGKVDREARDYQADFMGARHISKEGWDGFAASAIRTAMIDACRTVGIVMTRAKMSVFVIADGLDVEDGTALVRILSPSAPERLESSVRNDNGSVDIRIRPMWREWYAKVTLEFDADMITADSVVNLLDRAGRQVGIGEGRPFSKGSCGQGWGTFAIETLAQ